MSCVAYLAKRTTNSVLFALLCQRIVGIDYVGYALGQTDTFQGTGVYSGIKLVRETAEAPAIAEPEISDPKQPGPARALVKEEQLPNHEK